jgi:hypothetical protein
MLPLDICESIVKSLAEDEQLMDLRQLSLVGKAFVTMCQKQLFREVTLVQMKDWDLAYDVVQFHPMERFHQHLSAYPHLASYVRVLEIGCMMNYDKSAPFAVLDLLSRVTKFTFGFSNGNRYAGSLRSWPKISEGAKDHINKLVQRNPISTLSLFGIEDLPLHFIQSFSCLKDFSVQHVLPQDPSAKSLPAVELDRLELLDNTMDFIQLAIASAIKLEALSELKIEIDISENRFRPNAHRYEDLVHHLLSTPTDLRVLDLWIESE